MRLAPSVFAHPLFNAFHFFLVRFSLTLGIRFHFPLILRSPIPERRRREQREGERRENERREDEREDEREDGRFRDDFAGPIPERLRRERNRESSWLTAVIFLEFCPI